MRGKSSIPTRLRLELASDPWYKKCARECDSCDGRITFEHALIYAGHQINKRFAIIPLCEYHHAVGLYQDGGDLRKDLNEFIAIGRMTEDDMKAYPRFDWVARLTWLKSQFVRTVHVPEPAEYEPEINYQLLGIF